MARGTATLPGKIRRNATKILPELVAGVVVNGDLQSKGYVLQDAGEVKLIGVMSGR